MEIVERIKDKWLTWRTGKNAQERAWQKWLDETVVFRAGTVENMFMNFEHIIEVDPEKMMEMWHPFGWHTNEEFRKFEYPNKQLGDNAVWYWVRCRKDQWDHRWHIDELGGEDHMFVATNNERDAVLIALKFSG